MPSGILTVCHAADLRDVARRLPLERCLIETDSRCPAPVPQRGKSNQPAWVTKVAAELARDHGLDVEDVAVATRRNFERLFSRVASDAAALILETTRRTSCKRLF